MIQTLDFFTPIVDDPYMFGQIAASNALSDVWAMGGEPVVALNIVCFPNCLQPVILAEIMAGGADKVKEAGAVLVGGHSVQDDEPKYGLCVSGLVHPNKIYKNYGCQPGDVLILTKQLGSGVINTAIKGGLASESEISCVQKVMASLNKTAKRVSEKYTVHACTDITGFGFLGHCAEMVTASSGVSFEIHTNDIAFMDGAAEYAKMGFIPAGTYSNMKHTGKYIEKGAVEEYIYDLLYDPQSSGGLLFSVPKDEALSFYRDLRSAGMDTEVCIAGEVVEKRENGIYLL